MDNQNDKKTPENVEESATNQGQNYEMTQAVEGEPVEEYQHQKPKKKGRFLKLKIILVIAFILAILFLLLFFKLREMYTTYQNADRYEKAYDITQEQFKYCEEIQGEKQEKRYFDYCDVFLERFEEAK